MIVRLILSSLCAALALVPLSASSETLRVAAGESIGEALSKALPGSVVEVEPGVYHEALVVDTPGITLRGLVRGAERPVLDGKGELNDGVIASGSPFTMTGFGVRHYKGNGVATQGVDGVVLSDLVIDDTGLYGVYPVESRNIEVTHCTVTRISDAAIYVGESQDAVVAYNEVFTNVAGIEIENTNDAVVHDNLAYDNTAGILAFVLPNKVQKEGHRTTIRRNWVVDNNRENFGDPEAIVGALPRGLGIMVMGADETVVEDNWVKRNGSAGILVVRLAAEHAEKDPELDPLTDGARIGFNHVSANGTDAHAIVAAQAGGGGDIVWDGTGSRNCADLPDFAVPAGVPLPACGDAAPAAEASSKAASRAAPVARPEREVDLGDGPVVRIRGMRYVPRHIAVEPGDTVTWVNEDAVTHTVTSGRGTTPTSAPLASTFLARGAVYRYTFEEPGEYEYLCLPHLDQAPMRGATVRVGAGAENP